MANQLLQWERSKRRTPAVHPQRLRLAIKDGKKEKLSVTAMLVSMDQKPDKRKLSLGAGLGEDEGDANVKDITIENFSVSARGKELLKNAPVKIHSTWKKIWFGRTQRNGQVYAEVIGDDKTQLCKKFEIYDDESCQEEWESGSAGKAPKKWRDYSVEFHFPEPTELTPPLLQPIDVVPGEVRRSQKLRIGRHFVDLLTTDETPVQYILRLHPDQEGLSKQEAVRGNLGKFGLPSHNRLTPTAN
ncbi:hypothetical protein DKX38_012007 [Salix brachista]|uniref:Uncharacterized protein n=1 Tax=Salix brachista TaxID=2182728 RepID=A0A5N5LM68_9ROSI|nr:hypothetical protein DKX38_012007 [Salix brachista]